MLHICINCPFCLTVLSERQRHELHNNKKKQVWPGSFTVKSKHLLQNKGLGRFRVNCRCKHWNSFWKAMTFWSILLQTWTNMNHEQFRKRHTVLVRQQTLFTVPISIQMVGTSHHSLCFTWHVTDKTDLLRGHHRCLSLLPLLHNEL